MRPTLTCHPEAHGAQRRALVLRNDEQAVIHFGRFGINCGQQQRKVPGQWSVRREGGAVRAQFLHVFVAYKHCPEHHLVVSPPLDGVILKVEQVRVQAGQRHRPSDDTQGALLLCGETQLERTSVTFRVSECRTREAECHPTQAAADGDETEQQSCAPQRRRHCPPRALLRTQGAETIQTYYPS